MSVKTSEKKVVSRRVAIGLVIACIVLLSGLIGAILVMSDKDSKISALNEQITSRDVIISSLNTRVANLTIYEVIANLDGSATWVDSETVRVEAGYETVWNATANYAGYVSVEISSSTIANAYVRMTYSSFGVDYDNQTPLGGSRTVVFPVLPASIQISLGNPGITAANATVTIIYHY
jgi:predicted PurR-regulated permease PerM